MVCKPDIQGELADDENLVLMGNHVGHLDPLLLMYAASRRGVHPRFYGTNNLFRLPIIGQLMRAAKYQPVTFQKRNSHHVDTTKTNVIDLVNNGIAALQEGEVVAGFSARITHRAGLKPERQETGLARMALAAQSGIQPVTIVGAQNTVPFDEDFLAAAKRSCAAVKEFSGSLRPSERSSTKWPFRRPRAVIAFGDVIPAIPAEAMMDKGGRGLPLGRPGEARKLAERVTAALETDLRRVVGGYPGIDVIRDPTRPIDEGRAPRTRK
jgi:1-acyl-sn-glycerol-3-phosphate acyltransferase